MQNYEKNVDLGKIIDEIVPWIILLGMFLPYLKKVRRAKAAAAAKRPAPPGRVSAAAAKPDGAPKWDALQMFGQLMADTEPEHEPEATAPEVPALPDEGIRATADMPAMEPVTRPRCSARSREIRRALVWSDILQRKY